VSGFVVALDGPAGSGKSSVSKAAARRLGFAYLDTGAAYRAVAWHALNRGVDYHSAEAVIASLGSFDYATGTDPDDFFVRVGDDDITLDIREPRVSSVVSFVARVPEVRSALNDKFRVILAASAPGIIAEGRDITTVVAPDAPVRILLTASEEARAARRSLELPAQDAGTTATAITARDAADAKVSEFMSAAEGVATVDSTELNFEQTVDAVVALIEQGRSNRG